MISNGINGKDVSLLGFGLMRLPRVDGKDSKIDYAASQKLVDFAMANGVSYYDTAFTYAGSEEFAGAALSKYPRDSYSLATKCPPWKIKSADDFERIFNEQLRRCKTDYFDFYLIHNFAQELMRAGGNTDSFEKFEKVGFYDMLMKKKAEGKVRALGFSFHGTIELLEKFVSKYEVDFGQLQINYIDWTATDAKSQYEILNSRNIPITIMEPLRGGALAKLSPQAGKLLKEADPKASIASWGFRYVASLPGVVTILSGMNDMGQLIDNLSTFAYFEPLDEQDKELLYKAASIYKKAGAISCTECGYCMPCPVGVNIPRVFSIYNHARMVGYRIPFDNGYATLDEKEKASACTGCGLCVKSCPQSLDVPKYMQEVDTFAQGSD
ncbi:MAG: aldo/keto reductase [Oscillospiraceae bacterium]|nr:aldo/keto reductase [Oscillospiraceae bacterium]